MILSPFCGQSVRQVGIEMPGAAGGLRDPMKIDPQEFDLGDEGHLLLHWRVGKVRFEPIDKDDPAGDLRRVHVFDVDEAAIVDGEEYVRVLAEQRARVALAKEKERGERRLGDDFQLGRDHMDGKHEAAPKDGCPVCHRSPEAEAKNAEDHAEGRHDGEGFFLAGCPTCEEARAADLDAEHATGSHSDLVAGCPSCDLEADAAAAEELANA